MFYIIKFNFKIIFIKNLNLYKSYLKKQKILIKIL